MERVRARSVELTGYLESRTGMPAAASPSSRRAIRERRGAQLSIRVPGSVRAVCERLADAGVICDWREPDILRVAPAPLYNTAGDIDRFVDSFVRSL
jgi:kynureninase